MGNACIHVPGDTSLQKLVDQEVLTHGRRCFLVDRGDRVVGLLTLHNLKEIPRPSWATTTAAQAMIPVEKLSTIDPNAELWTAMEKMGRDGINQMPVIDRKSTRLNSSHLGISYAVFCLKKKKKKKESKIDKKNERTEQMMRI